MKKKKKMKKTRKGRIKLLHVKLRDDEEEEEDEEDDDEGNRSMYGDSSMYFHTNMFS